MDLLQNPETFLRKYPIINTFDCAAHGQTNAYFRNDRNDTSRLGTANFHTTQSFNVESVSGANAYDYQFPVHGIYTGPSTAAPLWYMLDNSGPAMMLTAKLTGCTFVARAGIGQSVQVMHVQPVGADTG